MEISEVQDYEEIASFGGALLTRDRFRKFKIMGGTKEERMRAEEWAGRILRQTILGICLFCRSSDMSRMVISPRCRRDVSARSIISRETDSAAARSVMAWSGRVTAKPCFCSTSFLLRVHRCRISIFGDFALLRNVSGTVICSFVGFKSESS